MKVENKGILLLQSYVLLDFKLSLKCASLVMQKDQLLLILPKLIVELGQLTVELGQFFETLFHFFMLSEIALKIAFEGEQSINTIMSVPVQLNRPASAAVTAVVIPIHPYYPKLYVTCRNVSVQTEAIRCAELFEPEATHDGDIYLKVFHNADTIRDGPPDDRYGEEQFWLNRHAQQTYFLYDSDEDDYGYARASIYHRNREGAPQSVVWRSSVEAKEITPNAVSVNAISGLYARNFAVQTNPAQIPTDLSLTTLFDDDVIEWD